MPNSLSRFRLDSLASRARVPARRRSRSRFEPSGTGTGTGTGTIQGRKSRYYARGGIMSHQSDVQPLPILAVLGSSDASAEENAIAERVGAVAARAGWVVLTGGGAGVMEAASRGAVEADGLTVGILPTNGPDRGYPNDWVRLPIYTGSGSARNAFNVLSANLCIAIGGGPRVQCPFSRSLHRSRRWPRNPVRNCVGIEERHTGMVLAKLGSHATPRQRPPPAARVRYRR